ncbi:hypothetical protein TN53_38265 [Streptomyces sp. WM6386]|nr:hypothetical protein TN53_38265 [Streptomyces sp. WM6386]
MWASPSQSTLPRLRLSSSAASLMASRAATRDVPAFSRSSGFADSTMSIIWLRSWPSKLVLPKWKPVPEPPKGFSLVISMTASRVPFWCAASWCSGL